MVDESEPTLEAIDERVDHLWGPASGDVILEYGDYECPYSRRAFRAIQQLQQRVSDVRFAFRHFPLTDIHPNAASAAAAAEAAALQGMFWEMHTMLFHRQKALDEEHLRGYAGELGLDLPRFEEDRLSTPVTDRLLRDVRSAVATGEVRGTPTLFINGSVYRGPYDADSLFGVLGHRRALD
jgi:protein-disulfide isomerase